MLHLPSAARSGPNPGESAWRAAPDHERGATIADLAAPEVMTRSPCPGRPSGRAPAGRAPCPVLWRVFRSRRHPSAVLARVAGMARPRCRGDRLCSGRRILAAHRHQPLDPRRLRSARRTPAADDCTHRRDPCRRAPVRLGAESRPLLLLSVLTGATWAAILPLGEAVAREALRAAIELRAHPALGLDRLHPGRDRIGQWLEGADPAIILWSIAALDASSGRAVARRASERARPAAVAEFRRLAGTLEFLASSRPPG